MRLFSETSSCSHTGEVSLWSLSNQKGTGFRLKPKYFIFQTNPDCSSISSLVQYSTVANNIVNRNWQQLESMSNYPPYIVSQTNRSKMILVLYFSLAVYLIPLMCKNSKEISFKSSVNKMGLKIFTKTFFNKY